MLKVQSKIFYIPIFAFGTFEELEATWLNLHNIMLISYFIGLAFLVYNMILYFVTRDKSFMYYCIYIFGLLLVCVAGRSYLPFGLSLSPQIKEHLMDASLIMIILGLGLFTKHFLKIEDTFATLSKSLCIASLTLVATLLFDFYVPVLLDFRNIFLAFILLWLRDCIFYMVCFSCRVSNLSTWKSIRALLSYLQWCRHIVYCGVYACLLSPRIPADRNMESNPLLIKHLCGMSLHFPLPWPIVFAY